MVDCDETHLRKSQNTLDVMCIEGNGQRRKPSWKPEQTKPPCSSRQRPYDEVNVLCCLIGKRLGTKKTISRVRMPEYYQQMQVLEEYEDLETAKGSKYYDLFAQMQEIAEES